MEWKKVLKGMVIAAVGAGLAYGTEHVPSVELGAYTPIVVAAYSVLANIVRKWFAAWVARRSSV